MSLKNIHTCMNIQYILCFNKLYLNAIFTDLKVRHVKKRSWKEKYIVLCVTYLVN